METIDLLNKTPKEMIQLMRKEIELINSMKSDVYEDVYIENKETKRREKVMVKSSDLILKALSEKNKKNLTSVKYVFEAGDVLSYSDANIYSTKETSNGYLKTVKHSKQYNEYASKVSEFFNEKNNDGMLEFFLKQEKLMIIIQFNITNIKKDNDNITKPFIDCLFYNVKCNDNNIKRIYSSVKKSYTGKDFIEFQLIKMKESDWESGLFVEEATYVKDEFYYESIF